MGRPTKAELERAMVARCYIASCQQHLDLADWEKAVLRQVDAALVGGQLLQAEKLAKALAASADPLLAAGVAWMVSILRQLKAKTQEQRRTEREHQRAREAEARRKWAEVEEEWRQRRQQQQRNPWGSPEDMRRAAEEAFFNAFPQYRNANGLSHLEVLGLDAMPATSGELRRAYRAAARRAHPDTGGSAEAFYAVQQAYDTLSQRFHD